MRRRFKSNKPEVPKNLRCKEHGTPLEVSRDGYYCKECLWESIKHQVKRETQVLE